MNKHEAQLLLAACRPGGEEAEDAEMRSAMAIMRDDQEMAKWFKESQALDTAIAARIASVPVPASLMADILAGARVAQRKSFWRSGWTWMAVAAAIVLAFFILPPFAKTTTVATLGEYRSDVAAAFASMNAEGFKPTLGVANMAEVAKYVETQHAPLGNASQPGGLASVKPLACRVIEWRGQKVSIICVGRDDLEAHVFVVDRKVIRDSGDVDIKAIAQSSEYPVTAWEDDKHAYVMVGNTKKTDLSKLML
jgi:hypothetical protein